MKNRNYVVRLLVTTLGIALFAFGAYLTIRADIGLGPWESFFTGSAKRLSELFSKIFEKNITITYGNVALVINILLVLGTLLLKEKIGFGTVLDTVLSGTFVDIYQKLMPIPEESELQIWVRIILLVLGIVIMGFAVYFYMSSAVGCGPRDSLLVALDKRMKKIPVGVVRIIIDGTAFVIGFILDSSNTHIGTIVVAFGLGPVMNLAFRIFKFDSKSLVHESVIESTKKIIASFKKSDKGNEN